VSALGRQLVRGSTRLAAGRCLCNGLSHAANELSCALQCHVRFPGHSVDMQTTAVAWLRTARCRMPLPRRGGAECRTHTAPLSAPALPAPHCWGHALDSLPPPSHVAPSPHQSPPRGDSVPIRFGGRWAAGGRLRDDISRGRGEGAAARATTRRTGGPPPEPIPPEAPKIRDPPAAGAAPAWPGHGRYRGACVCRLHRGPFPGKKTVPKKVRRTIINLRVLQKRKGSHWPPQIEALHAWPRR